MTELIVKETITSLEVAERTGKRHADVIRDIRKVEPAYIEVYGAERKFALSDYKDSTGRTLPMYNLDKSQSLFLATGYNPVLRAKVQKLWEERENVSIPQTFAQALRLAAEQQEKIEQQEKEKLVLQESNEKLQIELDEHKAWYSVKRVCLLGHFKSSESKSLWRKLKKYSIENNYRIHSIFDANYGNVKTYHKDVWFNVYGVEL